MSNIQEVKLVRKEDLNGDIFYSVQGDISMSLYKTFFVVYEGKKYGEEEDVKNQAKAYYEMLLEKMKQGYPKVEVLERCEL